MGHGGRALVFHGKAMRVDHGDGSRVLLTRYVMIGDDDLGAQCVGPGHGSVGGDACVAGNDQASAFDLSRVSTLVVLIYIWGMW